MSDTYDIATEWLRWSHAHGYDPNPEQWLDERREVGGEEVTVASLKPAIQLVYSLGLIKGQWPRSSEFPLRPVMTEEGKLAMVKYNGNVRAWEESQRSGGSSYADNRSYSVGQFANFAADSPGAVQTVTVGDLDLDQVARAASAAAELAELPRIPSDSADQLRAVSDEIKTELEASTPNKERVLATLKKLAAIVVPLGSTSTIATTVAELVQAILAS